MSNYKVFEIDEHIIHDWVRVEHGAGKILLAIHKQRREEAEILLTPEQAKEIAKELNRRAQMIEKSKGNDEYGSE